MLREALIQKSVIRIDEIENTAVFAKNGFKEQLGFFGHGLAEFGVKSRVGFFGWSDMGEIPDLEPLIGKVSRDRFAFRVCEHSLELLIEILAQCFFLSQSEEFFIGHGAPKKIRKASRQRVFVYILNSFWIVRVTLRFTAKQKMRRNEHCFQSELHRLLE